MSAEFELVLNYIELLLKGGVFMMWDRPVVESVGLLSVSDLEGVSAEKGEK
jgi:hypothetical protein